MATTFNVEQLLVRESGRIGPDIYRKTVDTSPWLKLVNQDVWPDEMGDQVSVLVYERSLPYNYNSSTGDLSGVKTTWNTLGSSVAGGTNNIVLGAAGEGGPSSSNTIEFGQRLRQYGLRAASLNSPDLSLNDLRFPLKRKEQLSNIMAILSESTGEVWKERYYDEYVRLSENKFIAGPGNALINAANNTGEAFGTITEVTTSGSESPAALTQVHLDKMYLRMIRDGGAQDSYGRQNGAPLFLLITSYEQSDALIKANGTSGQTATRDDFRWSDRANELLGPLGVQRTYKGFHHLVDPFPRRYNYDAGAWTRVFPFKRVTNGTANGSRGGRYDLNDAYDAAEYEETIIYHPNVFTSLVPKPISATGEMDFAPQTYRGEFTWRNIPDRDTNPDGTVGFFRAVFASGSKPVFPNLGYVIRHRRLGPVV